MDRFTKVQNPLLTAHVGVVDDRFTPRAPTVVFVGADPKLVGGVGLQVVDDCFAGWAGLVDPLPVPLSVADGVEPGTRRRQITKERKWKDLRTTQGVPQVSVLNPQPFHRAIQSVRLFSRIPGCFADFMRLFWRTKSQSHGRTKQKSMDSSLRTTSRLLQWSNSGRPRLL